MQDLIHSIIEKNYSYGIEVNPPASQKEIEKFEKEMGFNLPKNFQEFYRYCNGFGCTEDIFNILSLKEIIEQKEYDNGNNWFYFAEYMIFSDRWGLQLSENQYKIFNGNSPDLVLAKSLKEFLEIFLKGNVFEKGGLYEHQDFIEKSI